MTDGHKYTFGYENGRPCTKCGSLNHWAMRCPETDNPTEKATK